MPLTSYQCKAGGQNVVNTGDHRGIIQLASLREKSKYEMKRRRRNVDREGNISKCTNVSACCIVKRTHQSLATKLVTVCVVFCSHILCGTLCFYFCYMQCILQSFHFSLAPHRSPLKVPHLA